MNWDMHASRQSSPKRREFRSAMMRRGSRVALLVGAVATLALVALLRLHTEAFAAHVAPLLFQNLPAWFC